MSLSEFTLRTTVTVGGGIETDTGTHSRQTVTGAAP